MAATSSGNEKPKQQEPKRIQEPGRANQWSVLCGNRHICVSDHGNQVRDEGLDSCALNQADCRFYKYIQK